MTLTINEFMPISQKSEIDLSKKFTVFVGKNNSGKTYVSQLIWAINSFSTFENRYYSYENNQKIDFINKLDKSEIQIEITKIDFGKILQNFTNYIEAGDDSIDYASLSDEVITPEIKDDAIKTKGYFIYPSQLYSNIAKTANTNPNLNTDFAVGSKCVYPCVVDVSS